MSGSGVRSSLGETSLVNRTLAFGMLAFATLAFAAPVHGLGVPVPWVNGDFELGGTGWAAYSANSYQDANGDGDNELVVRTCAESGIAMSRSFSMGTVPASTSLAFDVQVGELDIYDVRMILADANDPMAFANGWVGGNWLDDQVLAWWSYSTPLSGPVVLDPVDAHAYNVDGWADMSDAEREARLNQAVHAILVIYACAYDEAALDDFRWVL